MSLIRFQDLTKRYDSRVVLRSTFFRLAARDRVGLIGKNGSGKTTILRLILGREEPTSGEVQRENGLEIGYFSQFSELQGEVSVQEVLQELFVETRAVEAELGRIETRLREGAPPEEMVGLLGRQTELLGRMDHLDGWTYQHRIDTVLSRLGFDEAHRNLPIDQLSGGWRNRAALAKILLQNADVLLLDEPTNYLDIEGLAWLEGWLSKLRSALLLVSHDRHFLDRIVTRIVEIENYQLHEYQGNFTDYVHEKPTRLKVLQNQYVHEQKLLAYEAEAIVERREEARNPSQALKRRLSKIKTTVEPKPVVRIITALYDRLRVRDSLCKVLELSKSYCGQPLFKELTFEVRQGHRLCVIGPNGCGKSTLLRVLALQEPPTSGSVLWQAGTAFAFFNQVLAELDPKESATHAVNTAPLVETAPRRQVNQFLEMMQFSQMALNQPIGTLSGGQQARVALAKCLFSGAAVVVLDEPTNHLDLTSTQVMEQALIHFPGAVIAVSHDRFFIDKVANRLLIFPGEGPHRIVEGNWTIWQGKGAKG